MTRVILGRLALPDAKDLLVNRDQVDKARIAAARARELQDRLNGAVDAYGAGVIDLAELSGLRSQSSPRSSEAQAEASTPSRAKVLGDLVSRDPAEVWASLSDESAAGRGGAPGRRDDLADAARTRLRPGVGANRMENVIVAR